MLSLVLDTAKVLHPRGLRDLHDAQLSATYRSRTSATRFNNRSPICPSAYRSFRPRAHGDRPSGALQGHAQRFACRPLVLVVVDPLAAVVLKTVSAPRVGSRPNRTSTLPRDYALSRRRMSVSISRPGTLRDDRRAPASSASIAAGGLDCRSLRNPLVESLLGSLSLAAPSLRQWLHHGRPLPRTWAKVCLAVISLRRSTGPLHARETAVDDGRSWHGVHFTSVR